MADPGLLHAWTQRTPRVPRRRSAEPARDDGVGVPESRGGDLRPGARQVEPCCPRQTYRTKVRRQVRPARLLRGQAQAQRAARQAPERDQGGRVPSVEPRPSVPSRAGARHRVRAGRDARHARLRGVRRERVRHAQVRRHGGGRPRGPRAVSHRAARRALRRRDSGVDRDEGQRAFHLPSQAGYRAVAHRRGARGVLSRERVVRREHGVDVRRGARGDAHRRRLPHGRLGHRRRHAS